MASVEHKDATQVHKGAFYQSADPAADVTQDGVFWFDTTSGVVLKVRTGTNTTWTTLGTITTISAFLLTLLDDADAATARATLGLTIGTHVQAQDAELAAIAGLTSAANKGITFTGSGTAATYDLSAFALTILDDANQAAAQATLGVVPGTHVQAFDADLSAIAGLTSAADKGIQFTGSGTAATYDLTTAGKALLDDASAAVQRATLGLLDVATEAGSTFTYALTDAWKYIRFTDGSPQVTVPPNGTIAFPVGTELYGIGSTGQVELIAGVGVTINTAHTLFTRAAFSVFGLKKVDTNEWDLMGDLEPV
jgi:hypothetical protein